MVERRRHGQEQGIGPGERDQLRTWALQPLAGKPDPGVRGRLGVTLEPDLAAAVGIDVQPLGLDSIVRDLEAVDVANPRQDDVHLQKG